MRSDFVFVKLLKIRLNPPRNLVKFIAVRLFCGVNLSYETPILPNAIVI
ncbi:hypothetical protein CAMRE0001_2152 [Campylobacter rectus RM3267]|uniref:Uncharacterized protein n=1 Tax=Campylobacter rectus RM3267 TaxID=553218 RepID=B9D456_CAMRE|nr:hypothetical protein CAMRE0001_2152 [Campylobacter rectus RM3267]